MALPTLLPLTEHVDGREKQPLSQAEYEAIKAALPTHRDLLFFKLLRGTGLRIAEALRMTPFLLRRDGPHVCYLVRRGKTVRVGKPGKAGKKGQTFRHDVVPLHPELATEILGYIDGNRIRDHQEVFDVSKRQLERVFKAAAIAAFGRPANPHQLRALYTKGLIDAGIPMEQASPMLGHSDPRTTRRHYYDLTLEERVEINRSVKL